MQSPNGRTADHPINPIFLERFSPRAFTGEAMSEADLLTIFEAARWAPSSYNSQPWRFLYARRDTPMWDTFLNLLVPGNQGWAKDTAVLVILISKISMSVPGKEIPIQSYSHSLDAGAAWGYLALQAQMSGWAAHAMVGFDLDRTAIELDIPADYRVEIALAIGRQVPPAELPDDKKAKEKPNGRTPIATLIREGKFAK
ncbi:nitroreductase family protein [Beijerinckia sp. L45]|uniref:nitroreductase family protein n=1 Tax=Beijerinckia sp. L45 TaxID=1641855 RepID=UPI00131E2A0A|nr:nitroreductase family protein [Beijerinckia sp. L45]